MKLSKAYDYVQNALKAVTNQIEFNTLNLTLKGKNACSFRLEYSEPIHMSDDEENKHLISIFCLAKNELEAVKLLENVLDLVKNDEHMRRYGTTRKADITKEEYVCYHMMINIE